MKTHSRGFYRCMDALMLVFAFFVIPALALALAAPFAFAQQPQQPPTFDEVMAAKQAVEGQRDFAQQQAQNAAAAVQKLGRELAEAKAEIEKLKKAEKEK